MRILTILTFYCFVGCVSHELPHPIQKKPLKKTNEICWLVDDQKCPWFDKNYIYFSLSFPLDDEQTFYDKTQLLLKKQYQERINLEVQTHFLCKENESSSVCTSYSHSYWIAQMYPGEMERVQEVLDNPLMVHILARVSKCFFSIRFANAIDNKRTSDADLQSCFGDKYPFTSFTVFWSPKQRFGHLFSKALLWTPKYLKTYDSVLKILP